MAKLLDDHVLYPSEGKPDSLVILLHGYGADGHDLLDLARHWQASFPSTVFHAPDAPHACEINPAGRQWFGLEDRDPEKILRGVMEVAPILETYCVHLMTQYGFAPSQVVLLGFSQGTMVSLYTALRVEKAYAGIVGYSGLLIAGEALDEQLVSKPPVTLIHGDADPVVPVVGSEEAHKILQIHGVPSALHIRPGVPHGIDREGMDIGEQAIRSYLSME